MATDWISAQARADYRRSLDGYVIPFFTGWKLADVERADVRRLVADLERRGLAPASVVKNLTPLRAMFSTALDDGLVMANPCAGVRVNRRRSEGDEHPEAKAITRAELARVLAAIPERWLLLFELLAKTGLRISEALARNKNNRLKAAAELGISRMTLYNKMHRYGLIDVME